MTRVLALDTSTWWGSVALVEVGQDGEARVVAEQGERVDGSHAESLLPWIAAVLAEAGWNKHGIDLYAATCGPGSFTGIRVGLGTIRGLALATDRPSAGVVTLAAIAGAAGPAARDRLAVLEAGRGELYAALYDPSSSPPREQRRPWVGPAGDVLRQASEAGWVVVPGPGTERPGAPAGRTVVRLAAAAGRIAGAGPADGSLAPLYVRPPDALVKRRARS